MRLLLFLSLWNQAALPVFTDSLPPKKVFKTTIVTNAAHKESGFFYTIDDSAIRLTATPLPKAGPPSGNLTIRNYKYPDIDYVTLRRKGSAGRGALFGGLIGLGTGVIGGLASGNDDPGWFSFTAGQKAVLFGISGAVEGALIGLVIGALSRKKFRIGGQQQPFQEMKTTVLQKVYGTRKN